MNSIRQNNCTLTSNFSKLYQWCDNSLRSFFMIFALNIMCQSILCVCEDATGNLPNVPRDIKILVLIICSDNLPVYPELQKIWRSYMHYDRNHVEAYFIKADPKLDVEYKVDNDVIWSKTDECLRPCITNKTLLSLEAMATRFSDFDYVLRTNLSSFYVFPRLLNFLRNCPKTNFYCAHCNVWSWLTFGSGSGYLLSMDMAELLLKNKNFFINNNSDYDDVVVGIFFRDRGIKLTCSKRVDFLSYSDWHSNSKFLADERVFQYRIKNEPQNRLQDDVYMHSQLLKYFYGAGKHNSQS